MIACHVVGVVVTDAFADAYADDSRHLVARRVAMLALHH